MSLPTNDAVSVGATSVEIIPAQAVKTLLIIGNPSEDENLWLSIWGAASDQWEDAVVWEGFFLSPWEKRAVGKEWPLYGVINGIYPSETNNVSIVYY